MRGIEPLTSSLPRKRSTPELHRLKANFVRRCLSYISNDIFYNVRKKERETGFEPATLSLEG